MKEKELNFDVPSQGWNRVIEFDRICSNDVNPRFHERHIQALMEESVIQDKKLKSTPFGKRW